MTDYLRLYNLEGYLFDDLSPRFEAGGAVSAFDFFCVVIWKANRAKSKVAARLRAKGHADLDAAVAALVAELRAAADARGRLAVMMRDWGFRLPMATAVLTVFYPREFTVYDVRVCDVLGDFKDAQNLVSFDSVWARYEQYVAAVRKQAPHLPALRDKDRWLWGKSFAHDLEADIRRGFVKPAADADDPHDSPQVARPK